MKFYSKTKKTQKLGYRTSDFFRGKTFGAKPQAPKFTPQRFKIQHKG
ncbi:hypothetical protein HYV21_01455 [Candidatus Microgenomates bacterium]|nr:hypothetical protein [Candidatus Microgenomates bacterium]